MVADGSVFVTLYWAFSNARFLVLDTGN